MDAAALDSEAAKAAGMSLKPEQQRAVKVFADVFDIERPLGQKGQRRRCNGEHS